MNVRMFLVICLSLVFFGLGLPAFAASSALTKLPPGATQVAAGETGTMSAHDMLVALDQYIEMATEYIEMATDKAALEDKKAALEELLDWRKLLVPIVERVAAKEGSPTIDEADFPEIGFYHDGTGVFWIDAQIPITAPFPVIALVKRCEECPFLIAKGVWPESGIDGLSVDVQWLKPVSTPDKISNRAITKTAIAGDFEIKIAVLHYPTGVFMTKTFGFQVNRMDFWASACTGTDGQSVLDIHIESIHYIADSSAYVVVNGQPRYVELVRNEDDWYRATATIETEQDFGSELDIYVQLRDRAQEKHFSFPYGFYPCGGKG